MMNKIKLMVEHARARRLAVNACMRHCHVQAVIDAARARGCSRGGAQGCVKSVANAWHILGSFLRCSRRDGAGPHVPKGQQHSRGRQVHHQPAERRESECPKCSQFLIAKNRTAGRRLNLQGKRKARVAAARGPWRRVAYSAALTATCPRRTVTAPRGSATSCTAGMALVGQMPVRACVRAARPGCGAGFGCGVGRGARATARAGGATGLYGPGARPPGRFAPPCSVCGLLIRWRRPRILSTVGLPRCTLFANSSGTTGRRPP